MAAVNFQLEAVKKRFPEYKDDILALYRADTEFRTIVDDYFLCISYLEKFKKEFSEKIDSITEYERMQQELEKELKNTLINANDKH